NYNYLTDNRCNINNNYGIWIYFFSNDNSLINNTCNSNNYDGIHLYASDLNLLSWNLLFDNVFGVYLSSGSDNNTIHHNTFINNSNSPQAYDDGSNNIWFDILTNEGNFWSDYSGSGNYQIGGGAGSIDPYPSNEPTVIIIIAEFTLLKGSFLALFMSFVRLCHIRRKNIKVN
ncbi:MAG: right-handed parallel beta-helix repeat-containing protein, partial [Candidatus Heimdallarchaeota archaeon]|nr:right-handed parallel beta-helix repeat-containing protein [Candidatus Heimdallarchaeota archaeon]MCK5049209.1 right-handed parallel beta-helix repeat-containing protein [Candidatus Heimdallarchaeota archaeon]